MELMLGGGKFMKKIFAIILILSFTISLVACSSGDGIDPSKKAEITICYPLYQWGYSKNTDTIIDEAKKAFETKYKNIKVNLDPMADVSLFDINKKIENGQKVDVIITMGTSYSDYDFSNDTLSLPLENLINKNRKFFDNVYDEGVLSNISADGKTFMLPLTSQTYALYYNKNILKKYNIDLKPEWTWEDFYNACSTINKGGTDALPSTFKGRMLLMNMNMDSYGIKILDEKSGKSNLSNPHILDAINFEKRMRELDCYNDIPRTSISDLNLGFYAFYYMNINLAGIRSSSGSFPNVDVISLPANNKDGFIQGQYSYGCINKNSDVQKEAFEFLKGLLSEEIQNKVTYGNPVNKNVFASLLDPLPESLQNTVKSTFDRTDFSIVSPLSSNFTYSFNNLINQSLEKKEIIDENYLIKLGEAADKELETYKAQKKP